MDLRFFAALAFFISLVPVRATEDVAIVAIAALTDPAKLATLQTPRAANDRLLKCVYWLENARSRDLLPDGVITQAQATTDPLAQHATLVRTSLLRNLDIASKLGCLTANNAALMRRGMSPTITLGPYAGERAEVDHIVPIALAPELGNELANLELMPRSLNRRKGASVGERQIAYARKLSAAGLLTHEALARVESAPRAKATPSLSR